MASIIITLIIVIITTIETVLNYDGYTTVPGLSPPFLTKTHENLQMYYAQTYKK